ncbi:MAG: hypothetical protein JRG93_08130 [Deltaproteobacteria bacterium]|nr:hypothetical protein [Deltaproteobacteria bacterium]
MDFFEEQALARRRTVRLVLLFAVAVVGIVVAVYFLAMVFYGTAATDVVYPHDGVGSRASSFWNPSVLLFALGSTTTVIGLGSLYKTAQLRDGGRAVALSPVCPCPRCTFSTGSPVSTRSQPATRQATPS